MKRYVLLSISVLLLVVIIYSMTSASVIDHSDHYTKMPLLYRFPWERDVHGNIHVKYYYEQKGSYYYGYRILKGAQHWQSFAYSPFDSFTREYTKSEADICTYSDDYGNTSW
jgi:hypothetical protein